MVPVATKQSTMWAVMKSTLPVNKILDIGEIYSVIEAKINLEPDDFEPSSKWGTDPRWKRNVRNILQNRKASSQIIWMKNGKYFIPSSSEALDLNTRTPQKSRSKMSKEAFDRLQRLREKIGEDGEEYVFEQERSFLASKGRPDLAEKVERVSLNNMGAGFDISSFCPDGSEKYIEVKTSVSTQEIFEWSANEIDVAEKLGNKYWLYLVRDIANRPRVVAIQNPASKIGDSIRIKPTSFLSELI